jgi:hypothetical protein
MKTFSLSTMTRSGFRVPFGDTKEVSTITLIFLSASTIFSVRKPLMSLCLRVRCGFVAIHCPQNVGKRFCCCRALSTFNGCLWDTGV